MATTSITTQKTTKRGRPKKEGLLREPNGRVSRSKKASYLHTLEVRAKKHKLTLEQAADPRAENFLGRLAILGKEDGLSTEQYEAALKFLKIRNDYKKSILSKDAYYEGRALGTDPEMMDDYDKWTIRVKQRYARTLKAIEEAQLDNNYENLHAGLQYIVIEGLELPHLLGATRMALNALYRHYNPIKNKRTTRYYKHSASKLKNDAELYPNITENTEKPVNKVQKNRPNL